MRKRIGSTKILGVGLKNRRRKRDKRKENLLGTCFFYLFHDYKHIVEVTNLSTKVSNQVLTVLNNKSKMSLYFHMFFIPSSKQETEPIRLYC